jgi:sacsin
VHLNKLKKTQTLLSAIRINPGSVGHVGGLSPLLICCLSSEMFSRTGKKAQGGTPQRVFAGQQTTIANEIRRNLDNYADTQLLEELTQNADDAGATRVAFMLDQRTHATKKVYGGDMGSLQGPALLAYDDAIFKESDFQGLFNFGHGSKKLDPTKSGKFGLGFNTVYHITEAPMFVSGPYLMILDPQRKYYPGLEDHSRAPGMQSVVASENWDELADFFGTFQQPVFGCDLQYSSALNGTLFRFPLRTKAQAKKSMLRSSPYVTEGIMNLWSLFEEKASRMLLVSLS